jgi:hypothetical protein
VARKKCLQAPALINFPEGGMGSYEGRITNELRTGTSTFMLLKEAQISKWLRDQQKTVKDWRGRKQI